MENPGLTGKTRKHVTPKLEMKRGSPWIEGDNGVAEVQFRYLPLAQ